MYWFEYNLNTPNYIINNITLVKDFTLIEYIILITIFIISVFMIYYIISYISLFCENYKKEKEKEKRKKLIQTIVIQKDLDDEIEKELQLK